MPSGNNYFSSLDTALKASGAGKPLLVLDLDRLDHNIETLQKNLNPKKQYRIVAKSLPCVKLLQYISNKTDTKKLMVFHQPFMNLLADQFPNFEFLVGKPMPVRTVKTFYEKLGASQFNPTAQMQWLVDTPHRITQYESFAKENTLKLKINIEIDVGLHRGGLSNLKDLEAILNTIKKSPENLEFSGFMGYDAHIPSAPPVFSSIEKATNSGLKKYNLFVEYLKNNHSDLYNENLTFNGGGSKTYMLYNDVEIPNDISTGSALVKPTDFDAKTLTEHIPALFIAAPVLKKWTGVKIPFLESVSQLLFGDKQTLFIYGGKWMAKPEWPEGLKINNLYGRSTNQEMLNCPKNATIDVDDFVFLRPTQSEFMMLQFGNLAVVRDGKIVDFWEAFKQ